MTTMSSPSYAVLNKTQYYDGGMNDLSTFPSSYDNTNTPYKVTKARYYEDGSLFALPYNASTSNMPSRVSVTTRRKYDEYTDSTWGDAPAYVRHNGQLVKPFFVTRPAPIGSDQIHARWSRKNQQASDHAVEGPAGTSLEEDVKEHLSDDIQSPAVSSLQASRTGWEVPRVRLRVDATRSGVCDVISTLCIHSVEDLLTFVSRRFKIISRRWAYKFDPSETTPHGCITFLLPQSRWRVPSRSPYLCDGFAKGCDKRRFAFMCTSCATPNPKLKSSFACVLQCLFYVFVSLTRCQLSPNL